MKFLRATDNERFYGLQPAELQMLLVVLSSFPMRQQRPSLSRLGDSDELVEAQKLLDEALKEQRATMRTELEEWLKTPSRFHQEDNHLEWRIENDRREWLLQIFNDVRVGAWTELGSPDDLERFHEKPGEGSMQHLALMEMAGMFQSALLLTNEAE